jgi:hypothetical protein
MEEELPATEDSLTLTQLKQLVDAPSKQKQELEVKFAYRLGVDDVEMELNECFDASEELFGLLLEFQQGQQPSDTNWIPLRLFDLEDARHDIRSRALLRLLYFALGNRFINMCDDIEHDPGDR